MWSHCPSTAVSPDGTVVMWSFKAIGKHPKLGPDPWGNTCKGGAAPCGFAKHGCGKDAPPVPPAPPAPPAPPSPPVPPSPPAAGGSCQRFASVRESGYSCADSSCLSDGAKQRGHCGQGLCADGSTSALCEPLACAGGNYSACSTAAAARCDAEPKCHGFALYHTPWRGSRAQFFGSGASGVVAGVAGWTAYTKAKSVGGGGRGRDSRPSHEEMVVRYTRDHAHSRVRGGGSLPLTISTGGVAGPWASFRAAIEGDVGPPAATPRAL